MIPAVPAQLLTAAPPRAPDESQGVEAEAEIDFTFAELLAGLEVLLEGAARSKKPGERPDLGAWMLSESMIAEPDGADAPGEESDAEEGVPPEDGGFVWRLPTGSSIRELSIEIELSSEAVGALAAGEPSAEDGEEGEGDASGETLVSGSPSDPALLSRSAVEVAAGAGAPVDLGTSSDRNGSSEGSERSRRDAPIAEAGAGIDRTAALPPHTLARPLDAPLAGSHDPSRATFKQAKERGARVATPSSAPAPGEGAVERLASYVEDHRRAPVEAVDQRVSAIEPRIPGMPPPMERRDAKPVEREADLRPEPALRAEETGAPSKESGAREEGRGDSGEGGAATDRRAEPTGTAQAGPMPAALVIERVSSVAKALVARASTALSAPETNETQTPRLSLFLPTGDGGSVRMIVSRLKGDAHRITFVGGDRATADALRMAISEIRSAIAQLPLPVSDVTVVSADEGRGGENEARAARVLSVFEGSRVRREHERRRTGLELR